MGHDANDELSIRLLNLDFIKFIVENADTQINVLWNNDNISREKLRNVENFSCERSLQNSSVDKFAYDWNWFSDMFYKCLPKKIKKFRPPWPTNQRYLPCVQLIPNCTVRRPQCTCTDHQWRNYGDLFSGIVNNYTKKQRTKMYSVRLRITWNLIFKQLQNHPFGCVTANGAKVIWLKK